MCVHVDMNEPMCVAPHKLQQVCGGQRTTCEKSVLSPTEIKFRSSGLMVGAFTCSPILTVKMWWQGHGILAEFKPQSNKQENRRKQPFLKGMIVGFRHYISGSHSSSCWLCGSAVTGMVARQYSANLSLIKNANNWLFYYMRKQLSTELTLCL